MEVSSIFETPIANRNPYWGSDVFEGSLVSNETSELLQFRAEGIAQSFAELASKIALIFPKRGVLDLHRIVNPEAAYLSDSEHTVSTLFSLVSRELAFNDNQGSWVKRPFILAKMKIENASEALRSINHGRCQPRYNQEEKATLEIAESHLSGSKCHETNDLAAENFIRDLAEKLETYNCEETRLANYSVDLKAVQNVDLTWSISLDLFLSAAGGQNELSGRLLITFALDQEISRKVRMINFRSNDRNVPERIPTAGDLSMFCEFAGILNQWAHDSCNLIVKEPWRVIQPSLDAGDSSERFESNFIATMEFGEKDYMVLGLAITLFLFHGEPMTQNALTHIMILRHDATKFSEFITKLQGLKLADKPVLSDFEIEQIRTFVLTDPLIGLNPPPAQ